MNLFFKVADQIKLLNYKYSNFYKKIQMFYITHLETAYTSLNVNFIYFILGSHYYSVSNHVHLILKLLQNNIFKST